MPHRLRGVGRRIGRIAFVSNLEPQNISISPTFGTDAGGTAVTINGTNIVAEGLAATIGGASCTSVVFVSATTMTCVTPSGTAGARDVVLTTVNGSGTQTGGYTYTAAGGIPADAVFFSDWLTATGSSDAAILDTDKTVAWENVRGNAGSNVVSSSGLDFPTTNVYQASAIWRPANPGASQTGPDIDSSLSGAIPAIGDSIFYRVYLRIGTPDAYGGDQTSHPYGDGPGGGDNTNWQLQIITATNGTWRLDIQVRATAFPNTQWAGPTLNKNQTYRLEHQIHRLGTLTCHLHVRVYDSSDVLIATDADFDNRNSTANLASNPTLDLNNVNFFTGIKVGLNGLSSGVESDFPFVATTYGAVAMRTDDWCGSFAGGF